MSGRNQRTMVAPINVIFKYLQTETRVHIWLYDILDYRVEGVIRGFDEFMNVTLDDAYEVWVKQPRGPAGENGTNGESKPSKKQYGDRTHLGRLLLKGENITLIQPAPKNTATASTGLTSTQRMEE